METCRRFTRQLFAVFVILWGADAVNTEEISCPAVRAPKWPYKHCRLNFNEFNFDSNDNKQFVELKKFCINQTHLVPAKLTNFKIVFFEGESGRMVIVCHLHNIEMATGSLNGYWYAVVGAENVERADVKFSECDSSLDTSSGIPNGKQYPFGIGLFWRNRGLSINLRTEGGRFVATDVSGNLKSLLQENLQDFYCYGSTTYKGNCRIFDIIRTKYEHPQDCLLRDWQAQDESTDFSVGVCFADGTPMKPKEKFWYMQPTPGSSNDCVTAFEFWRPQDVVQFFPSCDGSGSGDPDDVYTSNTDEPDIPYDTLGEGLIVECSADPDLGDGTFDPELYFDTIRAEAVQRDPDINGTEIILPMPVLASHGDYIWNSCNPFPLPVRQLMETHLSEVLNVEDVMVEDVCFWFQLLYNTEAPRKSKMRCKLCDGLLTSGYIQERGGLLKREQMLSPVGYMRSDPECGKRRNRNHIRNHVNHPLHKVALQRYSAMDSGLRGEELEKAMLQPDGAYRRYYNATENFCIAVFESINMKLPFNKFKRMSRMLWFFGANTGCVHNSPQGMHRMAMHIGTEVHNKFVAMLKKNNREVSLMVDTATDISKDKTMVVIFYYFDGIEVKSSLYGVTIVGSDGSASALWAGLLERLEVDGLKEYFRANLVGYASDGESTFKSAFKRIILAFTGRYISANHCSNHRLELALKNAFKLYPYVAFMDSLANSLYGFYSKSPKVHSDLKEFVLTNFLKMFELQYLYPIRWITSKLRAYSKILTHWATLVTHLGEVARDLTFSTTQRNKARELRQQLIDRTFLSHLAFFVDVTDVISDVSLQLQMKGASFIGKKSLRVRMLELFEDFKDNDGDELARLIRLSQCENDGILQRCSSLNDFENATKVIFSSIEVIRTDMDDPLKLSDARKNYLNSLISETASYFPEAATDNFDIFDPTNFPLSTNVASYGRTELQQLNDIFGWNYNMEVLGAEFQNLVRSLLQHAQFVVMRDKKPECFWNFYYRETNASVLWTPKLRRIVRIILCIPCSTAQAERMFSLYNGLKVKQRALLHPSTVENLLRVMNHGSTTDISMFDAVNCAKTWTTKYERTDDHVCAADVLPKVDDDQRCAVRTAEEAIECDDAYLEYYFEDDPDPNDF